MQLRRGQRVRIKIDDQVGILRNSKFGKYNGKTGVIMDVDWVKVFKKSESGSIDTDDLFAEMCVYQVDLENNVTLVQVPLDILELLPR